MHSQAAAGVSSGPAPQAGLWRGRARALLAAGTVFFAALATYLWTLAPTVTLVDSGELIVAARSLGIAHPPGFPLYVLLAHAATLLPFGNVARRVNFASALFAALAAALFTVAATEALALFGCATARPQPAASPSARPKKGARVASAASPPRIYLEDPHSPVLQVLPAAFAALLITFSRTLWAYATVTEVYTLNTLLLAAAFCALIHWRRLSLDANARRAGSNSYGFLYLAALLFGLGLGVHHVTLGLMLPALAALVYATAGPAFFRSRRFAYAWLFALTGLAIYLYLPLAASRSPVLNWGNPTTAQRLWWHITGRQYRVFITFSPETIGSEALGFLRLAAREFGPWWFPAALLLALLGLVILFRRNKVLFSFLALVLAADLAYGVSYPISEDKDAYYLPAFIALALAAGFGARWLLERARPARWLGLRGPWVVAGVLALVVVAALAGNYPFNNRRRYFIAEDYLENMLSAIPPGGMLLTTDWQVYSPLLYLREVEGERRDVVALDINLMRRVWYFDYLRREYPALMERNRDQVELFLEDLRHWEQDPQAYERDLGLNRRINSRFYAMILGLVSTQLQAGAAHITSELYVTDANLVKSLAASYRIVPQGLSYRLLPAGDVYRPVDWKFRTRGLADGTLQFEPDDVVKVKVLPVYRALLVDQGRYLAIYGRYDQATADFEQALALDPTFEPARDGLAKTRELMNGAEKDRAAPQTPR